MEKTIDIIGNALGALGLIICLLAGVSRVVGSHYLMGFETITLFIGGISIMVAACLAKLHGVSLQLSK
ncbi:MAG: hypothetical protein AMJ53_13335 [Gammaproteobacteria bacterium SG8_11]|nr:MAG: hypothetical protein AMJ53_13335 [Gammaproteobacteria bacterium SG8_11]